MTMSANQVALSYLVASVLFILALKGLSNPLTARRGNRFGIAGMTLAVLTTLAITQRIDLTIGALALGGIIGWLVAHRVQMTQMPELVAAMHSLVGLAAVLIAIAVVNNPMAFSVGDPISAGNRVELFIGTFVGAMTFSGSVIALRRLAGVGQDFQAVLERARRLQGAAHRQPDIRPRDDWSGHRIRGGGARRALASLHRDDDDRVRSGRADHHPDRRRRHAGRHFDVEQLFGMGRFRHRISSLNNPLLIVAGAMVGSSGAILSYIMCKAMNRSFFSVILGGFGTAEGATTADTQQKAVKSGSPDDVAFLLGNAESVIIIPGYGLAVARAQHAVKEMAHKLAAKGVNVRYAIHPVAGRMPGHMNVLLAEAEVPYEEVLEMDDINGDFGGTDIAFVLGANDVVNPLAEEKGSPIYGMPILEAHKARTVIVNKRSMASGYAGIDNPLFYMDRTMMVFGDAKKVVEDIVKAIE